MDYIPYCHQVQYYETDMMGVAHHANYIHWMEEARVDFMDQLGFPYGGMERAGIVSPVTKLACEYKHPSTFGDVVTVIVSVAELGGASLTIGYLMKKEDGTTVLEGTSRHVFTDKEGRILRLKRDLPEFYAALEEQL
ncbi:MAG: acyl-CoA thioesterase [Oscillospiraceae bacterium]|nr:acyl-CoA thioesterase [Oscillospiraceae bacterium]